MRACYYAGKMLASTNSKLCLKLCRPLFIQTLRDQAENIKSPISLYQELDREENSERCSMGQEGLQKICGIENNISGPGLVCNTKSLLSSKALNRNQFRLKLLLEPFFKRLTKKRLFGENVL